MQDIYFKFEIATEITERSPFTDCSTMEKVYAYIYERPSRGNEY